MAQSPLAPHAASAVELKERIEAERRGSPFLVLRADDKRQHIVHLGEAQDRVTIGRRSANAVALEWDPEVSRIHAALERIGEDWTLVDDGLSRNGSFVNGARISGRCRLRDGDSLRFGDTVVVYCEPSAAKTDPTVVADAATGRPLSETERKILLALCRPFRDSTFATPATNQAIADELFLSVDAVKTHLRALYRRFRIEQLPQNQKRARLAWEALQSGLISARDLWL
jgi:pSer/pThr/pTyr-binding forkhead associated (FHA) protein